MLQLNFSPFPELHTERLSLRMLVDGDKIELFDIRSNSSVNRFIIRDNYKSVEDAEKFISLINKNIRTNESILWAIELKHEKKLIGTICLWNIKRENFRAEIGFELHPAYQKRGLMNEAIKPVLEYGFAKMNLHTIAGVVDPENSASIKLMEKNNFVREAFFKEDTFYKGKFIDTAIYTLLSNHIN